MGQMDQFDRVFQTNPIIKTFINEDSFKIFMNSCYNYLFSRCARCSNSSSNTSFTLQHSKIYCFPMVNQDDLFGKILFKKSFEIGYYKKKFQSVCHALLISSSKHMILKTGTKYLLPLHLFLVFLAHHVDPTPTIKW